MTRAPLLARLSSRECTRAVARAFTSRPNRLRRRSPLSLRAGAASDEPAEEWTNSNDGFDEGEAMRGALDNPLFNDNFKKAFLEAQERLSEEQAPMKAQIKAEVDEIMKQVEAERKVEELESALPLEEEEEVAQEAAQVEAEKAREEVAITYADALDNPLFNDDFKKAFIEAQARLKEEQAPMRAKINAEVEEIMRQVNAEREAEARGETYTPSADDPLGALDAFAGAMSGGGGGGGAAARTPQPPPSTPPLMSRDEMAAAASRGLAGGETPVAAGILSEMLSAIDNQLGSLRSALAGVEKALRAEAIQNQRIRLAMDKAKKMARYAEADRIAAERRAEQERLEREGEGR